VDLAAADREGRVKRAAFRLQPVLELRRTEERAAAVAAAEAAQAAADADRRATERETAVATAVVPPSSGGGAFVATMTLFGLAAADAAAARALATASAEQAELVRAEWTEAAQRTKGLERLKERHEEALRRAELAAEERLVDDLVTGRAGRTPAEEVPWTE
jgi:flagellar biosynthesis chaperone FliJ